MTTVSRSTLLRTLAQDMFPDRYTEFAALAGSTDSVVQGSELRDGTASERSLQPGWFYCYAGTSQGDERQVTVYLPRAAASYGTITVGRPMTATPDTSSQCFVYAGGLAPTQLLRHLNDALRRSRRQRMLPLGLLSDGLMESSSTSAWTDNDADVVKTTSASFIYEGARALSVTNAATTGGYASSDAVSVVPGEQMRVESVCRLDPSSTTDTLELRVWNDTSPGLIASTSTSNRIKTRLTLEFVVPSGCYSVRMRLAGTGLNTAGYWDEVLVWRDSRQLRLPATITGFDQVLDVFERTTLSEDADDVNLIRLGGWELRSDPSGATQFVLDLARSGWTGANPIVVSCLVPWDELTSDASTTAADQDDVILRAKALCYAQMARVAPREDRDFYRKQADLLGRTWATAASRQPRPARPIKGPRAGTGGNLVGRWWRRGSLG